MLQGNFIGTWSIICSSQWAKYDNPRPCLIIKMYCKCGYNKISHLVNTYRLSFVNEIFVCVISLGLFPKWHSLFGLNIFCLTTTTTTTTPHRRGPRRLMVVVMVCSWTSLLDTLSTNHLTYWQQYTKQNSLYTPNHI